MLLRYVVILILTFLGAFNEFFFIQLFHSLLYLNLGLFKEVIPAIFKYEVPNFKGSIEILLLLTIY